MHLRSALLSVALAATLATAGGPARADWLVRRDAVGQADLLLQALDKAPDDEPGLRSLVDEVGLPRALAMAGRRAATARSWQAHFIEGRLLLRSRRFGSASAAFRRALAAAPRATDPDKGGALLGWIGEELLKEGRSREAHALLKAWIDRRPADALALKTLAQIALERRDLKAAIKYQGKLVQAQPGDPQLRLVHARMLCQAGDLDEAATAFAGALKLIEKDAELKCQTLAELGQLQETLEQFDAAVESYRRALKLAARGSYLHSQLQEQILRSFQRRYEDQKLEAEARKILGGQPRHRTALLLLAELLARRPGKLGEAIAFYERYLKVVPSDSKVRETVMFLLVGSSRTRQAVPHARALYQESQHVARRLLEYTGLLSLTGDREGAKKVLRGAIVSFKRDASTLQLIAEALDGFNDREGAKLALGALLELGKHERFFLAYGRRLWQRGSYDDALRFWGKSLGAAPDALAYEQWVEVVLSEGAQGKTAVRAQIAAEVERGLQRFPGHGGLRTLKRQLGPP